MSKLVPKLRFKEFSGEWEEKTLIDVSNFVNEKIQLNKVSLNNYISTENILPNFEGITKALKLPNIINITKFKKNDILISNIRPYLKKIWLANINGGASNDIIIIRVKENNNPNYLLYIVENDKFINYVMKGAKGVKMPRGDLSLIKKYPIFLPTPKEQQKIASTLSSLDNLIEATKQKVEALQKHKKGLMQQLFPSDGEKVPKLRFKEFSGEWEEKKLGEVIEYFKGFAFKSQEYSASGRRIIRVSDMGFDYIKSKEAKTYISEENAKKYDKWKLREDDLIVTTVGSKPPIYDSLVGRSIVVKLKDKNSLLNQNAVCLRANEEIKQSFLNILFKRERYIKYIETIIRGNANQGSIALKDLFEYLILLPKDPKEQQKIASTLSSLDNLIEATKQKVEALQKHKKGLMQQMFVSGEG